MSRVAWVFAAMLSLLGALPNQSTSASLIITTDQGDIRDNPGAHPQARYQTWSLRSRDDGGPLPPRSPQDHPVPFIVGLSESPLASMCENANLFCMDVREGPSDVWSHPDAAARLIELDANHRRFETAVARLLGRHITVLHRYRYAFNGMALVLTPSEALRVASMPGVRSVHRSRFRRLMTDAGPAWIGAPRIWSPDSGASGSRGEGIVIGVIDTGINIDHPSFSAIGGDGYQHSNPRGSGRFVGWCDPTNANFKPQYRCNDKLIGLWSYSESGNNPEDDDSHGSHTASTAAGNVINSAQLAVPSISITRAISGVAPHANVIAYDACTSKGCPDTATLAAIDQAVNDGVQVLNYSIALDFLGDFGHGSPWELPQTLALLEATRAGVFVAVAAGNDEHPLTVNGIAPWLTSVGAVTHDRRFQSAVVDFSGGDSPLPNEMVGDGITAGFGPARVVKAVDLTNVTLQRDDGRCATPFAPGTLGNRIVMCSLTSYDEQDDSKAAAVKADNVLRGGGGGMILADRLIAPDTWLPEARPLPAVRITQQQAEALDVWLRTGQDHEARLRRTDVEVTYAFGDRVPKFSSRGNATFRRCCRRQGLSIDIENLDVLKPEIAAPGFQILAAAADSTTSPPFALLNGTSMASPHVAGAAALLKSLHPDWSPAEVRSALMLTAQSAGLKKLDDLSEGLIPANTWEFGAGRVQLHEANRTGLIMDIKPSDYVAADPNRGGDPSTLNSPGMVAMTCVARCAWTRVVKSVLPVRTTWTARIVPLPGHTLPASLVARVTPSRFSLGPRGEQSLRVVVDSAGADLNSYFAQVVLDAVGNASPPLHMPIVVFHVPTTSPRVATIYTDRATGTQRLAGLQSQALTSFGATPSGLVRAQRVDAVLEQDPTPGNVFDAVTSTLIITVPLTGTAKRMVTEVITSTAKDIDLFVYYDYDGDGALTSDDRRVDLKTCITFESWPEYCSVRNPQGGTAWVVAQNVLASTAKTDNITVAYGVVDEFDEGNLTVKGPPVVPAGSPFGIEMQWSLPEIKDGARWYGSLWIGSSTPPRSDLGTIDVDLIGTGSAPGVPTALPAPTVTPVPTLPPGSPVRCVCPQIMGRVPIAAIHGAAANPDRVLGWNQPGNPGLPTGPNNPLRACLTIAHIDTHYHPLYNGLQFKVGCP